MKLCEVSKSFYNFQTFSRVKISEILKIYNILESFQVFSKVKIWEFTFEIFVNLKFLIILINFNQSILIICEFYYQKWGFEGTWVWWYFALGF